MPRKLVEIPEEHHETLTKIREHLTNHGGIVPTIPQLVKAALDRAVPDLVKAYMPPTKAKK